MIKEVKCLVRGLVQGVMYRDFVARVARWRALGGTVENLPDGSVQVIAQGAEAKLQDFIKRLRRGSLFARVESIAVEWREVASPLDGFRIIG